MKSLKSIRQLVRDTLHQFVLPRNSSVDQAEYKRMRAALEVAWTLIQKHHDCSKQVVLGQMCLHCCREDGSSPELDQIWDALERKNTGGLRTANTEG